MHVFKKKVLKLVFNFLEIFISDGKTDCYDFNLL